MKLCEVCEGKMRPHARPNARYCSDACRQAAYRDRNARVSELTRVWNAQTEAWELVEVEPDTAIEWAEFILRGRQQDRIRRKRDAELAELGVSPDAAPVSGLGALLRIPSAARLVGVTESAIRWAIRSGALPSFRLAGRRVVVYQANVYAWAADRRENGRHGRNRD